MAGLNSQPLAGGLQQAAPVLDDPNGDIEDSSPSTAAGVGSEFTGRARQAGSDYDSAKSRSDTARTQMIQQMSNAGAALRGLQFGPSDAEKNASMAQAWTQNTHTGRPGEMMSNVYGQQAANLKAQREADLQKAQLMSQYGVGLASAQYTQAQKDMADATGAARAFGTVGTAHDRMANQQELKGFKDNGDGTISQVTDGSGVPLTVLQERAKLAGKPLMLKNADGTVRPMVADKATGVNLRPSAPAAPGAPQASAAPLPASAGAAGTVTPATGTGQQPIAVQMASPAGQAGTSGAAPAPQKPSANPYTGPALENLPGTPYSSPRVSPAAEAAAQEAFSPQALAPFMSSATQKGIGYGPTLDAVAKAKDNAAFATKASTLQADAASHAEMNLRLENEMLGELNKSTTMTGPWANDLNVLKAKFQQIGLMSPEEAASIDSAYKMNKWGLALATNGLKSTYGARITNLDVQQALKSNPNQDMPEAAARALIQMGVQRDEGELHAKAFMEKYNNIQNIDPKQFGQWYRKYVDPYSASVFNKKATGSGFSNKAGHSAR